jgi:hypothetical protein
VLPVAADFREAERVVNAASLIVVACCTASPSDVTALVDQHIITTLREAGVAAAPHAGDAEFLRRVTLDLVGRTPTPDEVRGFLSDARPDKRTILIDRLLADEEHPRHFARVWRALLLPEADRDRQIRYLQPGLEAYLEQARRDGAGFDEIVRALVAAPIAGPTEPPQFVLRDLKAPNPPAFIASKDADPAKLAAAVSRLFLGVRLECAQCHNHPFDAWTREQFWNQAAFFAGIERRGKGVFAPLVEVKSQRSIPLMDANTDVAALFLDRQSPTFADGRSSRAALAEWIVHEKNPYFARAVVNRVWAQLLGRGLIEPVDDFQSAGAGDSHLLDDLARAFTAAKYDLDFLYRTIGNSAAYGRTTRRPGRSVDESSPDESLAFAGANVKPLSGEQFFASLAAAIGYESKGPAQIGVESDPFRRTVLNLFVVEEGTVDPESSVLSALLLMNDPKLAEAVAPHSSRTLKALGLDDPAAPMNAGLDELYLRTLGREPTPAERRELTEYLSRGDDDERPRRWSDVFWTLLNSAEFRWNH